MNTVRKIEHTQIGEQDKPLKPCIVQHCGELKEGESDGVSHVIDGDIYPDYIEDSPNIRTVEQKIEAAQAIKAIGSDYFKKQQYDIAKIKYEKCLRYLEDEHPSEEEKNHILSIKLLILTNLALCNLKLGKNIDVVRDTTTVLSHEKHNVKALYRRAQANLKLKEFELALDDLNAAQNLEPNNHEITAEIARVHKSSADYIKRQQEAYKGMFGSDE